jgi:hypothetical protein
MPLDPSHHRISSANKIINPAPKQKLHGVLIL